MSDSLGDGTGHPTAEQIRLYQRWAGGGLAISIIGEVQGNAGYAETPGNLVLNETSDLDRFRELAERGGANGTQLWLQLGHAGALAYAPTSSPKGPSALDLPDLRCAELTVDEIREVPSEFARTARLAQQAGFRRCTNSRSARFSAQSVPFATVQQAERRIRRGNRQSYATSAGIHRSNPRRCRAGFPDRSEAQFL